MELPEYTVYVEIPRLLFPKTLKLLFIGLVFYFALWLNFFFLKKTTPFILNIIVMVVIVIGIVISTILNYTKYSNYQYRFYSNRVEYFGDSQTAIMYNQVKGVTIKKNFFDLLFSTGSIELGGFNIQYVPNLNQVYFYIQKVVQMYSASLQARQYYPNQQQGYYPQARQYYPNQQQGYTQNNQYPVQNNQNPNNPQARQNYQQPNNQQNNQYRNQ